MSFLFLDRQSTLVRALTSCMCVPLMFNFQHVYHSDREPTVCRMPAMLVVDLDTNLNAVVRASLAWFTKSAAAQHPSFCCCCSCCYWYAGLQLWNIEWFLCFGRLAFLRQSRAHRCLPQGNADLFAAAHCYLAAASACLWGQFIVLSEPLS